MKAVHYWDLLHKFKLFGIVITFIKTRKKRGGNEVCLHWKNNLRYCLCFFFFLCAVTLDMGCQEHSKNVRLHSFVKASELHPIVLHDFRRVAQTMDWKPSTVNDNGLPELQVKNVIIRLSWGINYQSHSPYSPNNSSNKRIKKIIFTKFILGRTEVVKEPRETS